MNTVQINKMWKKNIEDFESKIPDVGGLVTTTVLYTKICEVENKIADVSVSSSVKKS